LLAHAASSVGLAFARLPLVSLDDLALALALAATQAHALQPPPPAANPARGPPQSRWAAARAVLAAAWLPQPFHDAATVYRHLCPTPALLLHSLASLPPCAYAARAGLHRCGLLSADAQPLDLATGAGVGVLAVGLLVGGAAASLALHGAVGGAEAFFHWRAHSALDKFFAALDAHGGHGAPPTHDDAGAARATHAAHVAAPALHEPLATEVAAAPQADGAAASLVLQGRSDVDEHGATAAGPGAAEQQQPEEVGEEEEEEEEEWHSGASCLAEAHARSLLSDGVASEYDANSLAGGACERSSEEEEEEEEEGKGEGKEEGEDDDDDEKEEEEDGGGGGGRGTGSEDTCQDGEGQEGEGREEKDQEDEGQEDEDLAALVAMALRAGGAEEAGTDTELPH
jgi:hypothetical protein